MLSIVEKLGDLFDTEQTFYQTGDIRIAAGLFVCAMTSNKKKFKVVLQTDPPNAKSANEEARWGKLADSLLRPETSGHESRSTSSAHRDHECLKQDLLDAVDKMKRAS